MGRKNKELAEGGNMERDNKIKDNLRGYMEALFSRNICVCVYEVDINKITKYWEDNTSPGLYLVIK